MIFATVGGAHLPFDRLVRAVDELAGLRSDETCAIQIGCSTYEPQHAEWFRFDTPEGIEKWVAQAEVVVSHGGFAILSECIRAGKKVVACPRRAEYGEAVNPQHELVTYLAKQGFLVPLYDVADLASAIEQARSKAVPKWAFESKIPEMVARYVETLV